MKNISSLSAVFATLASGAAAAPAFKTAPGTEDKGGEGGGWVDYVPIDTEGAPPWLQTTLEFLANNYGYIGVAAVLLMLFLFARGGGGGTRTARSGAGDDDDFFEPGDADNYRGGRRR